MKWSRMLSWGICFDVLLDGAPVVRVRRFLSVGALVRMLPETDFTRLVDNLRWNPWYQAPRIVWRKFFPVYCKGKHRLPWFGGACFQCGVRVER